ncbi:hypothetical protein M9Y10_014852 [Tritrichomonas musculus]|uniref:Uncharacterized protein n=1 Tax=Tritrichomonas musculus TaxID=1915356 RepID=A0ABR2L1S3_9EUKA
MLKNAASPIDVTLDGIVTFSIEVPVKAFLPIELRIESFSNSIIFNCLHCENEPSLISVQLDIEGRITYIDKHSVTAEGTTKKVTATSESCAKVKCKKICFFPDFSSFEVRRRNPQ